MPFVCKIDMDKHQGIKVELLNVEGATVQSIYMDGLKITTTVQGPAFTSTIVQDCESVTVTAERFVVNGDVSFGSGVVVHGDVEIDAPPEGLRVDDGTVLSG